MTITRPFAKEPGAIYVPQDNPREGGARVDFRKDIPFANQIEWHGLRFGWARKTLCPCEDFSAKTEQRSPSCPWCNGLGWTSYQTPDYRIDRTKVGKLNEVQQRLIDRDSCMVIRGLVTSLTQQPDMFHMLGDWALGSCLVTVRPENKIGYYDRLILLDDVIVYRELLTVGDSDVMVLRYPAEALNVLMSRDRQYGDDDVVLDCGDIRWLPGKRPPEGTRLSVSYLHHPVFVVFDYPHLLRAIPAKGKTAAAKQATPVGNTMHLPVQVVARLEFLPLEPKG